MVAMRILTEQELAEAKRIEFHARLAPLATELGGVELPTRLKARFFAVLEAMSSKPEESFPSMVQTESELVALYRFLGNLQVTPEAILAPHVLATCERAGRMGKMLVVHDTSGISYGGRGTRSGLGSLADGGHGYYLHLSLAVSADGHRLPLGVLGFEAMVRTEPPDKSRTYREKRRDPNKELLRWRRGVHRSEEPFEESDTVLIHVMDREGDDYELLDTLIVASHLFVIRSKYDRLLDQSVLTREERADSPRKLREALSEETVRFEREVYLSPRKQDRSTEKRKTYPAREGRLAKLHGSAARVRIKRPKELAKTDFSPFVELNVVRVWEVDAPEGVAPVEWYLLTTEPIETEKQILEVVDFYRARWVIEEFFKALKSGCDIEGRQLESKEALLNALAVFLPIAHRLLLLRSLARNAPTLPATMVFSDTQLQILRTMRPKLALPAVPSVHEALMVLAGLGGHLKRNGYPGWQTLGKGLRDLLAVETYLFFRSEEEDQRTSVQS
jgi:hypothetical protein